MPKVSIIIPAYNAERFLGETIKSALRQTFVDFEMIIVDDGSTDKTQPIAEEFVKQDPRIQYIYQKNQGHAVCRNTGLRKAIGEYTAFLDADDIWLPTKLEKQITLLESEKDLGMVHSARIRIDHLGNELPTSYGNSEYRSGMIFYNLLLRKAQVCTSTVVCRKSVLDEVGYFDETFPDRIGGEDRELWLRIARRFEIAYIQEPLVKYRYLKSSLSRSRKKETFLRGRFHVIDKSLNDEPQILKKNFLKRLAYSSVYREMIYAELEVNNLKDAIRHCRKAIVYFPLNLKLYGQYLVLMFRLMNRGGFITLFCHSRML